MGIHTYAPAGGDGLYFDDFSIREVLTMVSPQALFDDGDSISAVGHATYVAQGLSDLYFSEQAVGGAGLDGGTNSIVYRKPMMLAKVDAHPGAVVTILIGANDGSGADPVDYARRLFAYCDEVRAHGAKVALGTVLPQGQVIANYQTSNAHRLILNDLIRAAVGQHIDAVIDYGGDPIIGTDAAANDVTLFGDGLHPTMGPFGGQERMSQLYRTVVLKLLNR